MKFLRNLLATITGLFVFIIIIIIVFSIIFSVASKEKPVALKDKSVLHLKLNKPIQERELDDPFAEVLPGRAGKSGIGLVELRRALQHAKDDSKIKGILLEAPYLAGGIASITEVRAIIEEFKSSGKFVVSYADMLTEGGYYVSSVADEVYVAPDFGMVEFNGLSSERLYFKGTLDKLEIKPVVFRAGEFKSAAELFTEEGMSESEKEQTSVLINTIYKNILNDIADSRDIALDELEHIADSMLVRNSEDAMKYNLVDDFKYKHEVEDIVREKVEIEKDEEINFVSYKKYNKSFKDDYSPKNNVAVLFANGNIVSGKSDQKQNLIASEDFIEEIRKVRESDRIKAVVLRVNSPGGSALASDVIWNELKLTAEEKPLIASMSDVSASGGYFLSMACDTIVSHPNTITGSIGVIGMFFNLHDFLKNKLGITADRYKTGEYADLLNPTRPLREDEKQIVQQMVGESYDIFVSKAADDRGMSVEEMKSIAEGRVWSGEDALDIGLVDMMGNLEDAIKVAAEKAGVADDYKVKHYPRQKPIIEQIVSDLSGENSKAALIKENFKEAAPYVDMLLNMQEMQGIQARMPYELNLDL